MELNDDYFFNEGYFKIGKEGITETGQKWFKLKTILFNSIDVRKEMVTPQLLEDAINGKITYEAPKYIKPAIPTYKKIQRPDGYMTVKERKAKKAADKAARKAREEKYGRNVYRKT